MSNVQTGALVCPKCQGQMRQYERNGITIDQCAECRGVFLDRGELERLIEAENAQYAAAPAAQPGYPQQGYPPPQRSQGFLGGMFGGEHGGYRRGHH